MYSEFNILVKEALEDDVNAKTTLLERLRPLIISSIKKYCPIEEEFSDLMQDGSIIVLQCLKDYKKDRGVQFLYYVKSALRFYYLETFRYLKKNDFISLNIANEDGQELIDSLLDNFSIEENYLEEFQRSYLVSGVKSLPKRQREIVKLFYVCNLSISEIAKYLNISYRGVVNSKVKAIDNLRRFLSDIG